MRMLLILAFPLMTATLTAADDPTVHYYGFTGEPVELRRVDDGSTPWPVVSRGATPMPLTGRIGLKRDGADRIEFVELAPGSDPFAEARRLAEKPGVRWAQPEWLVKVRPLAAPNDPYYPREWHLDQLGAAAAWEITAGSPHTAVAVVDSGVDRAHPDLDANLDAGKDLTGSGSTDCDRPASGGDASLIAAHGTCVAGLIAAEKNNGVGIAGICPLCRVIPVKLLRYDETMIPVSRIYDAIVAAVDAGADIVNNSWGDEDTDAAGNCIAVPLDSYRAEAIRYAREHGRAGRGALTVWAAGNSSCDAALNENLKLPDILVVSALAADDAFTGYSNYGDPVDLCAGAANWTTDITGRDGINDRLAAGPTGAYDHTNQFSGTSAAAAVLSGVGGLLYSANPLLFFAEALTCLREHTIAPTADCPAGGWTSSSGDPYAPEGAQRSPCFGFGLPDIEALLSGARDGSCGLVYDGCDTDAACGAGFTCDTVRRECRKTLQPERPAASGGCALVIMG